MYKSKKPYLYGTGRRKSSVARVRLYRRRHRQDHHQRPRHRRLFRPGYPEAHRPSAPGSDRHRSSKVDIVATVTGGGVTGQAGAIRHGISRALLLVNPELPCRSEERLAS